MGKGEGGGRSVGSASTTKKGTDINGKPRELKPYEERFLQAGIDAGANIKKPGGIGTRRQEPSESDIAYMKAEAKAFEAKVERRRAESLRDFNLDIKRKTKK